MKKGVSAWHTFLFIFVQVASHRVGAENFVAKKMAVIATTISEWGMFYLDFMQKVCLRREYTESLCMVQIIFVEK